MRPTLPGSVHLRVRTQCREQRLVVLFRPVVRRFLGALSFWDHRSFEDLCFADWVLGGTLFLRTSVLLIGFWEVLFF